MENEKKIIIDDLVSEILKDYQDDKVINQQAIFSQPDKDSVNDLLQKLIKIMYPGYYKGTSFRFYNLNSQIAVLLEDIMYNLHKQVRLALPQNPYNRKLSEAQLEDKTQEICYQFFKQIPSIRELVETDVAAFFDGDPAAYNYNEIILCYPGLLAITTNRIAHELHLLKVPLIPRMMTEYAHSKTGIDIHPGATIGKNFFIDHGTGIVVGETTIIGDNVKVYQGVTIGALSTRGGQKLKGVKRHPTIEDDVIIYAGASILGGETVIGKGAVIGSNAFITSSIEAGARVSIKNQELSIKSGDKRNLVASEMETDTSWFYII